MKLKGFVLGVVGGIVGAALLIGLVVALDMNLVTTREKVVQITNGTASAAPVQAAGAMTPQEIYAASVPGAVEVISTFNGSDPSMGGSGGGQGIGTGFVVNKDGYILTNQHVVVNEDSGQPQPADSVVVGFQTDAGQMERVKATVVGTDATSDVALLKIDPAGLDLKPLTMGDSDTVQVGEPVVAIGNPLAYDFSMTSGIVSAVHRPLDAPNGRIIPNGIQTDAAINPGNSGGPLFNSHGEVIGINEQIASRGGGNEGLGFAVPINAAKRSMAQLLATGEVKYSWLGISGQSITPDVAKAYQLPAEEGVLVAGVEPGAPAEAAGLKAGDRQVTVNGQDYTIGGDIITAVDGKPINSMDELVATISAMDPGTVVKVTILRGDKTTDVNVTLAERPAN